MAFSPVTSLNLTEEQINSVTKAWNTSASSEGEGNKPGLMAFRQIFMQMDEIREVFGFLGLEDPNFIRHTKIFTNYLNQILSHLDNLPAFDELCLRLGAIHAKVRQNTEFRPNYWDTFAGALISCALDEPTFPVQTVWRKIVLYMIYKMKEGYYNALNN